MKIPLKVLPTSLKMDFLNHKVGLVIYLNSRMTFEKKPTLLQAAFLAEGIQLEDYRSSLPNNEKERSRHAALLYQANQRLKGLIGPIEELKN